MKLAVTGGRNQNLTEGAEQLLARVVEVFGVEQLLHGDCRGLDRQAALWAQDHGVPVVAYPADWNRHGRAAGPIRNSLMAKEADAVLAFPGGKGAASMVDWGLKFCEFVLLGEEDGSVKVHRKSRWKPSQPL